MGAGFSIPDGCLGVHHTWVPRSPATVVGDAAGGPVGRRRALTGAEDRWALALVVAFTVLCLITGLRNGQATLDVDEVVYQQTVTGMQDGRGYYDAMHDALVAKEGAPPSQVRSVRPPTMFLVLLPVPEGAWRWLSALVSAASLVLAWRIGRSRWPLGGPLAVAAVGLWMVGAAPLLYLHAELWGLPFALAGVLAMRRGWWAWAALAFGAATCTRELYLVFLLAGLAFVPAKRWVWALTTVGVGVLGAVHWHLASRILEGGGKEAAFGKGRSVGSALSSLSPADRPVAWLIGVVGTALGGWVVWRLARGAGGRPELIVGLAVSALMVATLVWGRTYWGLTFGPILACYAVMAPTCRGAEASNPAAVPSG
jgi:hypothetical protein